MISRTRNQLLYTFALSLILAAAVFPQSENLIVDLGTSQITAEEFKFRFELSPYLQTSRDIDSLKTEFLYTLIAEKLWADEAVKSGFAENVYVRHSTEIIEKYFVRDELYKREVLEKAVIPERDLTAAIKLASKTFEVNFLHSSQENVINELYNELSTGAGFDSLLQMRPEAAEQREPIFVKFGQMKRDLEKIIFNLTPGEFSRPVPTEKGWMIFYVKNIVRSSDTQKAEEIAKKTLENRLVVELQDVFYRKFIKGSVVNADKDLFQNLFEKIQKLVLNKTAAADGKIHLGFYDFRKLKTQFSDSSLNTNFVKVREKKIPLEYFIDDLAFNEVEFADISALNTASRLNAYLRNFIQSEIIAQEGYSRGLQNHRAVRNNVALWKEHFLAALYKNSFINEAKNSKLENPDEIDLEEFSSEVKYRIRELTLQTLEDTEKILARIEAGDSFAKIISDFSGIKEKISDWFHPSERAEIGESISSMEVNEIYGPVKTNDGFLIFQLIEKKRDSGFAEEYNSFLDSLTSEQVFNIKMRKVMTQRTLELARKSKVDINYGLLKEVKVSTLPVFVYRYFGFGGRISAVPYLTPFHEWFKKIKKEGLTP